MTGPFYVSLAQSFALQVTNKSRQFYRAIAPTTHTTEPNPRIRYISLLYSSINILTAWPGRVGSSAGTKSGSSARSLVLLTMLAPVSRTARLGDQLGLDDASEVNSIIADHECLEPHTRLR